jgi:N-acetyl-gamma-glutamyl-phosphate reductase
MPLTALMQKELIKSKNIIVDAKSGYSGAGKVKNADQLLGEVNENIKSYGVGDHKHIAEINQELTDINEGTDVNIFFSANLIPVKRGILSNIYIQPNNSSSEEIYDALVEKFENERFVSVLPIKMLSGLII